MTNLSQAPVIENSLACSFHGTNKVVKVQSKLKKEEITGYGNCYRYLAKNDFSTIIDLEEDPIEIDQYILNHYDDGRCEIHYILEIDSRYAAEI